MAAALGQLAGGNNQLSLLIASQAANRDAAARRQLLFNPAISGFTEQQLANSLNFAFGSGGLTSVLGGVGLENLGLPGLPGGTSTSQLLSQGNDLFNIGLALGGPDSLAAKLQQKADVTAIQAGQQSLREIQTQMLQLLALRQRGIFGPQQAALFQQLQLRAAQIQAEAQQGIRGLLSRSGAGGLGALGGGAALGGLGGLGGGAALGGLGGLGGGAALGGLGGLGGGGIFGGNPLAGLGGAGGLGGSILGGLGGFQSQIAPQGVVNPMALAALSQMQQGFNPLAAGFGLQAGFGFAPMPFNGFPAGFGQVPVGFGQPVFGQPVFGQPVVVGGIGQAPAGFGQPVFGQQAFGTQPIIFGQPIFGQPQIIQA